MRNNNLLKRLTAWMVVLLLLFGMFPEQALAANRGYEADSGPAAVATKTPSDVPEEPQEESPDPAAESESPEPSAEGESQEPPAESESPEPSAEGESQEPPAESESPEPPAESESQEPPAESESPEPPAESESPEPPAESESPEPPAESESQEPVTKFTVTWKIGDQSVEDEVESGAKPSYPGEEPKKDSDENYHYSFAGWQNEDTEADPTVYEPDDELPAVTENVTYVAQFTSEAHAYGNGTVVKEPTCTEKGSIKHTCSSCGYSYTEETDALGHDWGEPTFTFTYEEDDGTINVTATATRVCKNDAEHKETKDCTVSYEVTKAATCTQPGTTEVSATVEFDGTSYPGTDTNPNFPAAKGHQYDESGYCPDCETSMFGVPVYVNEESENLKSKTIDHTIYCNQPGKLMIPVEPWFPVEIANTVEYAVTYQVNGEEKQGTFDDEKKLALIEVPTEIEETKNIVLENIKITVSWKENNDNNDNGNNDNNDDDNNRTAVDEVGNLVVLSGTFKLELSSDKYKVFNHDDKIYLQVDPIADSVQKQRSLATFLDREAAWTQADQQEEDEPQSVEVTLTAKFFSDDLELPKELVKLDENCAIQWNESNKAFQVTAECEKGKVKEIELTGTYTNLFDVELAEAKINGAVNDGVATTQNLEVKDGAITSSIYVDRQSPVGADETTAPDLSLEVEGTHYVQKDGTKVFTDNPTITATVTDGENGSGVAKVEYQVGGMEDEWTSVNEYPEKSGKYSYTYVLPDEKTKDSKEIYVRATDNAGNSRTVTCQICYDKSAPRLEWTISSDSPKAPIEGTTDYYNSDVKLTATYTDPKLDVDKLELKYKLDGSEKTIEFNTTEDPTKATAEITVHAVDEESNPVANTILSDAAVNVDNVVYSYGRTVVVDNVAPTVKWNISPKTPNQSVKTTDYYTDYYSTDVTLTVTVTDANLDISDLKLNYSGAGTATEWEMVSAEGETPEAQATITIPAAENAVLSDVNVTGADFAQNPVNTEQSAYGRTVVVDNKAPKVTWTISPKKQIHSRDTTDYYNSDVTLTAKVEDPNLDVKSLKLNYKLNGKAQPPLQFTGDKNGTSASASITVPAFDKDGKPIAVNEILSNVKVIGADFAENPIDTENTGTYGRTVVVDSTAPKVTWTISPKKQIKSRDTTDYYNSDVTLKVKVEDPNLDVESLYGLTLVYELNGEELDGSFSKSEDGKTATATITIPAFDKDGKPIAVNEILSNVKVTAKDFAGKETESVYGRTVVVDSTAPKVTWTISPDSPKNSIEDTTEEDTTDYYRSKVTLKVKVEDPNLDVESLYGLDLVYELNGEELDGSFSKSEDGKSATATITIPAFDKDGKPIAENEILSNVKVTAKDFAGNETVSDYGRTVVVDSTAPKVTWTISPKKPNYSSGTTDYYNSKVTLLVKFEDPNLDVESLKLNYKLNGKAQPTMEFSSPREDPTIAVASITVPAFDKDGKPIAVNEILSNVEVTGADFATNPVKSVYGRTIVVDSTAPTVSKLSITGENVEDFFVFNNTVYVTFKTPTSVATVDPRNENGNVNGSGETFTVSFTVTDKNLQLPSGSIDESDLPYYVYSKSGKDGYEQGEFSRSASNPDQIVWTKTITVAPDACGVIALNVHLEDMAGNKGAADAANNLDQLYQLKDGDMTAKVTADRALIYSTGEGSPKITLYTEPKTTVQVGGRSLPLYVNDATFKLTVTDTTSKSRNNNTESAGIRSVSWSVTDKETGAVVATSGGVVNKDCGKLSYPETGDPEPVVLDIDGAKESDTVVIEVEAEDFSGNVTHLTKTVAVDSLAPRVTISFNNNNVSNGRYFSAARTATVTVNDIHFAGDSQFNITADAGFGANVVRLLGGDVDGAWNLGGTTSTKQISFNGDAMYTFAVDSITDAGGNSIGENEVAYVDAVAHSDFVVDKTAPEITVEYTNNDVRNGKYFKADRTAIVTIRDLSFDPTTSADTQVNAGAWDEGPENVYVRRYVYDADGDYEFHVSSTDMAGNATADAGVNYGNSAAPHEFTIDKTKPVILLDLEGNVANGMYYKEAPTGKITITEHNFNAADVIIRGGAASGTLPELSAWNGADDHVATMDFNVEGQYTYSVMYTDLAGNTADSVTQSMFVFDKTAPEIHFEPANNQVAYNGNFAQKISFTDEHFDIENYGYTLRFIDSSFQERAVTDKVVESVSTTDEFMTNALIELTNSDLNDHTDDGVYTIEATITDLAGNSFSDTLIFSLNRFGSTYTCDDATRDLLTKGISNAAPTLQITEINPNPIKNYTLTLYNGSTPIVLTEGEDFTVVPGTGSNWHSVTYVINASVFQKDSALVNGNYRLQISSTDGANNDNTNRTRAWRSSDDKLIDPMEINFTLDDSAPDVYFTGVKNGDRIQASTHEVVVHYGDNSGIESVTVFVNGEEYKTITAEELAAHPESYTLTLNESGDDISLTAIAKDAAGNTSDETEPIVFFLNGNAFQIFLHNTPLLIGSISGAAALAFLAVLLLKRKKKADK